MPRPAGHRLRLGRQLADQIVSQPAQVGGFTSAEDLRVLLDLSPDIVDGLRDLAIFPPR